MREIPVEPTDRPADRGRDEAPGLRDQFGATIGAGKRLLRAHVDLARAELGEVIDEVKRVALLGGLALGSLFLLGFLLPIGLSLFVGDWLFGSMGWGVLHGTLVLVAIAVVCLLLALGTGGGGIAADLAISIVLGVVIAVILGLNLPNQLWTQLGSQVAPNVGSDVRPLVTGTATLAIVLAALGLLFGALGGGMGGAILGLVGGAILGAALGALSAITYSPEVAAALGVTVALLAWPVLMGVRLSRQGVDTEALKARFIPSQTIDTTKETIEWVRAQTPLGRKS